MKTFVAAVLAAMLACANAQADGIDPRWSRMTEIFTRNDNAYGRGDVFANTATGTHRPASCGAGVWCTIDVADYGVPSDAKAVFLSGILIITHGLTAETADLLVGFRAYGDVSPIAELPYPGGVWYIAQSVEAAVGSGQRSTMSTWVPVRDGKFQFTYSKATGGAYPTNSAYGINLTIQAWGR